MLVIKPYGRTRTQERTQDQQPLDGSESSRLRILVPKARLEGERIERLKDKGDFLIAHWISVIDKIIIKPKPKKKATTTQYEARRLIGASAWGYLEAVNPGREGAWSQKLHPYGTELLSRQSGEKIKGRLYNKFAGKNLDPAGINDKQAQAIAAKIHAYLSGEEENTLGDGSKIKGHIAHQLSSIVQNVHRAKSMEELGIVLDEKEWQEYFKSEDVVDGIYKAVFANHQPNNPPYSKTKTPKLTDSATVAQHLFKHYANVFGGDTKVSDLLEKNHPKHRQWLVHQSIKATYKALFDNASLKRLKSIHTHFPKNKEAMWRLIERRQNNQKVSHLVRLGKVIHYQATKEGKCVRDIWKDLDFKSRVAQSSYWLSEGQSEIKRSEALVRSFKLAITHAAHTLSRLCDWKGEEDIYSHADDATKDLDLAKARGRLGLLFGRKAGDPFLSDDYGKEILQSSIKAWAQLRHASFHFQGKKGFLEKLCVVWDGQEQLNEGVNKLWGEDLSARNMRIRNSLEAAHCQKYLTQDQLDKILEAVSGAEDLSRTLELPRLNRVLTRAKQAPIGDPHHDRDPHHKELPTLPAPAKRKDLENSDALHCQYVLLKLLYERSFLGWLKKKPVKELQKWIEKAMARSDAAAKDINDDDSLLSRARPIWTTIDKEQIKGVLQKQDAIAYFFDHLAAATATEFRVQRFYESDGQAAQKQAAYIDNLKCDVVGLAFLTYLRNHWPWLLQGLSDQDEPSCMEDLPNTLDPNSTQMAAAWQPRLYFLLHFVPVGVVSQLLHQLRKWQILSGSDEDSKLLYLKCAQVMALYLDMHDAKFDGGEAFDLDAEQRKLLSEGFESEEDFLRLFPKGVVLGSYIPLRGLREMLRFGGDQVLAPVFTSPLYKITANECVEWRDLQDQIEGAQNRREELHAEWFKNPKEFEGCAKNIEEYKAVLEVCKRHRHLAHRVRLVDHVQLHSLLMTVLARLVDYAGLLERDMYFVTLALCHESGIDVGSDFGKKLDEGRIIEALRDCKKQPIKGDIEKLFGFSLWTNREGSHLQVRNDLSHFNMLRSNDRLDLTHWINQTRQLMAYDRKLKNSVSKSIKELLGREGFELKWTINSEGGAHDLSLPAQGLESKNIEHFKSNKSNKSMVIESHHGKQYTAMVRAIFSKTAPVEAG